MIYTNKEVLQLRMWKKVSMPEKMKNAKGEFEKTGREVEMTGYILHDLMGEEIQFISPKNEFRALDGKYVNIELKGTYSDYDRKNKFTLANMVEATKPTK